MCAVAAADVVVCVRTVEGAAVRVRTTVTTVLATRPDGEIRGGT